MGGVQAVLESLTLADQLVAQAALGLELLLGGTGRGPGARLLGAAEVGDQGGVEAVGLVAAETGLGVARDGQGLEEADGVAGLMGVAGHGKAVGAGGFQTEVERAGGAGPGQQAGVTGRSVGHGGGPGPGQEQAGVELVFGHVETEDGFGGTHEVRLLRFYRRPCRC
jgi:hypothetical protein